MSPCPTGGTCPLPPPCDPNPPRGQGTGAKGCGSWTQRPQEAGHSRTSQEDTLSTGSAAAATAGTAGEPRHTHEISGLGHLARRHNTVCPRPLLASRLAGGQCLKGDRWVSPLDFQPAAPAWRGVAPRGGHQAVTCALWPPAPPAPRQIFAPLHAITSQVPAPYKRPVPWGHASARRALPARQPGRLQRRRPSTEAQEKSD